MVAIVRFSSVVGLVSALQSWFPTRVGSWLARLSSGGQESGSKMHDSDQIPEVIVIENFDENGKNLEKEFEKHSHEAVFRKVVEDPHGRLFEISQHNAERMCLFKYRRGFWGATLLFTPEVTGVIDHYTKPSFQIRNHSDGRAEVDYLTPDSHVAKGPSRAIEDMIRDFNPFAHLKDTIRNHLSPKLRCVSLFYQIMSHPPPGGYPTGFEGFRMFMKDKHMKGIQRIE
ncbi:hypothetical protein FOL46_003140, partial [Perkinsus olseni]